ncbi:MAG: Rieske 2Fe-2S domain-containing protein [Hyphomicrobiaceae bacterium]
MLTSEENDLLCRVEGDAPMGRIFRSHWLPALLSEEIPEPDCDPVRVRLLGENLVAFRDSDGRIGLIDEVCPHRRASLFYGRNEECGLRCLYHGWKFDVDGNCIEMASEPAESSFCEKVKIKSYPVREHAGFIWTYMGAPDKMPEFEPPVFAPTPATNVVTTKVIVEANWAQMLEGSIDSAHSSSLHSSDMVPARVTGAESTVTQWQRPSTDKSPRLLVHRTSYGFRYSAIRRPIKDASTHDYVRTTLFVAPYTVHIPPNNLHRSCTVHVPRDDHSTTFYFVAFGDKDVPSQEDWRKFQANRVGIDLDPAYRNLRNRANNYKQDRKAMKLGNFTGVEGITNQDIVMWESMGPIVDRHLDRLGASDIAIVEFRKQMVEAARTVASGGPAIGTTQPRIPLAALESFQGIVQKGYDFKTLGASDEELRVTNLQDAASGRTEAAE